MSALGLVVIRAILQSGGTEGVLAEVFEIADGIGALEKSVVAGGLDGVIFGDVPGLRFAAGFVARQRLADVLHD